MNEMILPYVKISYIDPIVYCKYSKDAELGFPEIKDFFSHVESVVEGKKYSLFLDAYQIGNITNQGKWMLRNYIDIPLCKAVAVFINKDRSECLQNIIDSYQTIYPLRVFSSGQDAIDWVVCNTVELDSIILKFTERKAIF